MIDQQHQQRMYRGVYFLSIVLIFTAILLRTILMYQGSSYLGIAVSFLLCFMLLILTEVILADRIGWWRHAYLLVQTLIIFRLLLSPDNTQYDYFSLLFSILGMQAMRSLRKWTGVAWIGIFFIILGVVFIYFEGALDGLIRVVLFGSVILFLSAYSWTTRRAQEAHNISQSLMLQLQKANQQLEAHSNTLKQLGIAHERQRLARELHDSVTQTIFSMTLTTQSAQLLLERDPIRVGTQLVRLNQLAQSALSEMHTLISELRPEHRIVSGLVVQLQQHLQQRHISEGLTVSLDVEGDQSLSPQEDQGLFRITQEALNNVIKHAHATQARLHVHLEEPLWIEINDNGRGFNVNQVQESGRLGLAGMRERADEINWELTVNSTPGTGTCVRVEKINLPGKRL